MCIVVTLPQLMQARDHIAQQKCCPGGAGVRPERKAGIGELPCKVFFDIMHKFDINDLSPTSKPKG